MKKSGFPWVFLSVVFSFLFQFSLGNHSKLMAGGYNFARQLQNRLGISSTPDSQSQKGLNSSLETSTDQSPQFGQIQFQIQQGDHSNLIQNERGQAYGNTYGYGEQNQSQNKFRSTSSPIWPNSFQLQLKKLENENQNIGSDWKIYQPFRLEEGKLIENPLSFFLPLNFFNRLKTAEKSLLEWNQRKHPELSEFLSFTRADLKGRLEKDRIVFSGSLSGQAFGKDWKFIPLFDHNLSLLELTLTGQGTLFPVVQGVPGEPSIHGCYLLAQGPFTLQFKMGVPISLLKGAKRLHFNFFEVPTIHITLQHPEKNLFANTQSGKNLSITENGEGTQFTWENGGTSQISLIWSKKTPKAPGSLSIDTLKKEADPKKITSPLKTIPPLIFSESNYFLFLEENFLRGQLTLDLEILKTAIASCSAQIPPGVQILQVEGGDTKDFTVQSNRLQINFTSQILGKPRVFILFEKSLTPGQKKEDFSPFQFENFHRQRGFIALEATDNLGLDDPTPPFPPSILLLNPEDLPHSLKTKTSKPINHTYRFIDPDFQLTFPYRVFKQESHTRSLAPLVMGRTILSDENSVTELEISLQNFQGNFFDLELPLHSELVSCFLGEKPIKASRDPQGVYKLPLSVQNLERLEVTYRNDFEFKGNFGSFQLQLPKFSTPISTLNWEVFTPHGFQFLFPETLISRNSFNSPLLFHILNKIQHLVKRILLKVWKPVFYFFVGFLVLLIFLRGISWLPGNSFPFNIKKVGLGLVGFLLIAFLISLAIPNFRRARQSSIGQSLNTISNRIGPFRPDSGNFLDKSPQMERRNRPQSPKPSTRGMSFHSGMETGGAPAERDVRSEEEKSLRDDEDGAAADEPASGPASPQKLISKQKGEAKRNQSFKDQKKSDERVSFLNRKGSLLNRGEKGVLPIKHFYPRHGTPHLIKRNLVPGETLTIAKGFFIQGAYRLKIQKLLFFLGGILLGTLGIYTLTGSPILFIPALLGIWIILLGLEGLFLHLIPIFLNGFFLGLIFQVGSQSYFHFKKGILSLNPDLKKGENKL